jgi:DNA helicase-2/ATP-dependent DNA helicase PcrA
VATVAVENFMEPRFLQSAHVPTRPGFACAAGRRLPPARRCASRPPISPLLANLNPEQLAAVTLPSGHALILAGAGSGKTRVLTTRIAWLLQNGLATPGGILAVTFTNKAAKEMVARLSAMLPVNVRGMWIGTFHGLCNRLLRAHHKVGRACPRRSRFWTRKTSSRPSSGCASSTTWTPSVSCPSSCNISLPAARKKACAQATYLPTTAMRARRSRFISLYEEQCQREGVVDFGELMLRSFELLRDNDPIRAHYQHRFAHILVDEFQDTNKLQYAWLKQLAGDEVAGHFEPRGSVMAVGDDDQSIYAFRGARVGNMQDFVREFDVQRQIKLEQNYRSYSNILDSANALISHNSKRLGKNLRTERGPGEPVRVYEASSDLAEAQWMVDEIRQLVRNDGVARQEVAILYRSNAQSRVIETALFNAAVPYRVYGGLRFFERAEIKHALAYLRLLENPQDDTSFLRVVNFPPRGIGARSLELLQDAAKGAGCSLHDAVTSMTGKAGSNLTAFVAQIDVLREQTQGQPLRAIIEQMLESSGLLAHFRAERDGQDRIENLEELVNAAESFVMLEGFGRDAVALPLDEHGQPLTQSPASQGLDTTAPLLDAPLSGPPGVDQDTGETLSPLGAFLTHAALEAGDNQAQAGQDAVQLMTVHASKGLEFDVVFIGGLEEGLCPHENSLSRTGRHRGRAPPGVRGHHPCPKAFVPEPLADPHVAWPDALRHQKPLFRRTARIGAEVDHAQAICLWQICSIFRSW